jgi:hypothetical protein
MAMEVCVQVQGWKHHLEMVQVQVHPEKLLNPANGSGSGLQIPLNKVVISRTSSRQRCTVFFGRFTYVFANAIQQVYYTY